MSAAELIDRLELLGVELWYEDGGVRFRAPEGAFGPDLRQQVQDLKPDIIDELIRRAAAVSDHGTDTDPFPLTDVQAAYLVGRTDSFGTGGTGCHGYAEFDIVDSVDTSAASLRSAWTRVASCHDMLGVRVSSDGWQCVDPAVSVDLEVFECGDNLDFEVTVHRLRSRLRERDYRIGEAPMLSVCAVVVPGHALLMLSVDLLLTDFRGLSVLCGDFARCLAEPDISPVRPATSFREVVVTQRRKADSPAERRRRRIALDYWTSKVPELPAPLMLPSSSRADRRGGIVDHSPRPATATAYTRRCHLVSASSWRSFVGTAAASGLTPSAVFLALLARIGRRYADCDQSLLTVTVLDRPQEFPDVDRIVGDFTTTVAAAVCGAAATSTVELARTAQRELFDSLDHASVNGIEVGRMFASQHNWVGTTSPVVLTSTVGAEDVGTPTDILIPRPAQGLSRTPQVLLDVQISPCGEGISVVWDSRDDGFSASVLDSAFGDFTAAIDLLCDSPRAWNRDPFVRRALPPVVDVLPRQSTLLDPILAHCAAEPAAPAVIDVDRTVTRSALLDIAGGYAGSLRAQGCGRGSAAIVCLPAGIDQIAATVAALSLGACYVPVETDWPDGRRRAVREALVSAGLEVCEIDENTRRLQPAQPISTSFARPDDMCYIIFTSGSTGDPKGVVVRHAQVLTTLSAVDDLLELTSSDRVLAISRHSFDLSVFNVFGVLGAGGAVVVPSSGTAADARSWYRDIIDNAVTLWNSVPAQYQLLLDEVAAHASRAPEAEHGVLRAVMVSGDWVPVDQPEQSHMLLPDTRFIALGGATEASIWSNYFEPSESTSADSVSVPYGKALPGQAVWVLNADREPAVQWQTGQIAICGGAVAEGYLGRASEAFFVHSDNNERCYLTGDLGRLLPSGDIEFLGRADGQVKIHGHRIELGEIESSFSRAENVAAAVAAAVDSRYLAVALVPESDPSPVDRGSAVSEALRSIDQRYGEIVDRDALTEFLDHMESVAREAMRWARANHTDTSHTHLMTRWDRYLTDHPGDGPIVGHDEIMSRWSRVRELGQVISYGDDQLAYVGQCLAELDKVMTGERDPLALLFPEGRTDVAEAAYGGNLVARYLNSLVAEAIARWSSEHVGPVRILEIGGGVGATTGPVLEALADREVDYVFTDVSSFFLDAAAQRWPQLTVRLFDVTRNFAEQGLAPCSFDIIVAANVLHNARHIPRTLDLLHGLLTPGGALAVIDSTRVNAPLMVTMEFKEGLTDFDDSRGYTGDAFFDRRRWQEAFDGSYFGDVFVYPPCDSTMSDIAQSMMWAQSSSAVRRIDVDSAVSFVRDVLPSYMIPSVAVTLPALPMTPNGKVDREAVARIARELHDCDASRDIRRNAVGPAVLSEGQTDIAAVWAEVLGLGDSVQLGPEDNFFSLGGDSLLLARCVGRLRSAIPGADALTWDDAMRRMVADPTVRGCASIFASPDRAVEVAEVAASEYSCVVNILPEQVISPSDEILVLVHDGSGDVTPYCDVIDRLAGEPRRPRVIGVRRTPDDEYFDRPPAELFDWLADRYTRALPEARRVHVAGYCMGGLIAVAMAERLATAGIEVGSLTVVSSYRIPFRIDDSLLLDYAFARLMRRDPADMGLALADSDLARLIDEARLRFSDIIPDGCLPDIAAGLGLNDAAAVLRQAPPTTEGRLAALAESDVDGLWTADELAGFRAIYAASLRAVAAFDHPGFLGDITFVRQHGALHFLPTLADDMTDYWRELCLGDLDIRDVVGNHFDCMLGESAATLAGIIASRWTAE